MTDQVEKKLDELQKKLEKVKPGASSTLESAIKGAWARFRGSVGLEEFMGARLFAWLGGLALFVAAGFFVKYSIDQNLISPEFRLSLAALFGVGLIGASFKFERGRYDITRHSLASGGLGVLYAVAFAATLHYQFLSHFTGFAFLAVVSLASLALALYHQGLLIALLGALGAYLTPLLVNPGDSGLLPLFLYLAVLNLGFFGVAKKMRSTGLLFWMALGSSGALAYSAFFEAGLSSPGILALAWAGQLTLFTFFVERFEESDPEEDAFLRAAGILNFG